MKIVDTHQHLWDKDLFQYAWLEPLPILDRSFRLADYSDATRGLEIAKTVFVECDVEEAQILDEALHVLRLANDGANHIAGVVASGRPESDGFAAYLDKVSGHPQLKGIRRILHTHPDELGQGGLFVENAARVAPHG